MVATDVDYVDLGDVKRIEVEVRDTAGALANAGTVTLTITLPDGTTSSPAVSNPSTGVYRVDYLTTVEGPHRWRMLATGANASAHTDVFEVRAALSPALVSLLAVKAHINEMGTTTHDQELRRWIEAATQICESHPLYGVGPILPRTVVEDHDGGSGVVYLNQTPVISLTSVVPVRTGGTAVTVADLDVNATTGKLQYLTAGGYFPYGPYRFTYRPGYTVIPANVTGAALIIIKGLWETQRGATALPMQAEDIAEMPGMGLYMWRAKLLLDATPRVPGVA